MISVSAGGDFRYYVDAAETPQENYYTQAVSDGEPAGRWFGRGAAALGLSGTVTADAMEALYAHRLDPRDERFGRRSEWGQAARARRTAAAVCHGGGAVQPDAGGRAGRLR